MQRSEKSLKSSDFQSLDLTKSLKRFHELSITHDNLLSEDERKEKDTLEKKLHDLQVRLTYLLSENTRLKAERNLTTFNVHFAQSAQNQTQQQEQDQEQRKTKKTHVESTCCETLLTFFKMGC